MSDSREPVENGGSGEHGPASDSGNRPPTVPPGGDTNADDPGKSTERWAHKATVVAAVIAAVSLVVSVIFSWYALRAANAALNESQSQAWSVAGAANCHNYRDEVRALVKEHISEREIRAWFAAENGGIDNPYHKGKSKTSLADYENGCGHLNLLLAVLDPNAGPSERMLKADHIPPEALRG